MTEVNETHERVVIRRPRPQDAIDVAREQYLAGERVDMHAIAVRLGVGRRTLYRWLGDREALIGGMLAEMATQAITVAAERAEGAGIERVLDGARHFMELSLALEPLRAFVKREPGVALRVLMSPEAGVSRAIADGFAAEMRAELSTWSPELCSQLGDVLTQLGMAYEWASFAAEGEPDLDRGLNAMRIVLEAAATRG